jgi:hypothetical protein
LLDILVFLVLLTLLLNLLFTFVSFGFYCAGFVGEAVGYELTGPLSRQLSATAPL